MKLAVKDINGKSQGELEVKFPMVEGGRGTQAVHDVVVAYNANQRSGTACTKTMGEVAGKRNRTKIENKEKTIKEKTKRQKDEK